jgi:DNA-binding beta-propeller fold protein YncE
VASGDDALVRVFNGRSYLLLDSVKLERGANRIAFDPRRNLVYVGYRGKDAGQDHGEVAVIDAATDKVRATFIVDAHPAELLLGDTGEKLFALIPAQNEVQVIDTASGKTAGKWPVSSKSPGDAALDIAGQRLLIAEDGKVRVYDGASYTLRKTIDFGTDPDNMRYDAASKKVFVGFGEEDGGIAMIDPTTDERVGEVYKTGGHPESFQVEASGKHIYANVPDAGNVVESIDRKTGAVTKWPLKGLRGNYAMALNEEDHRLFTVSRKLPMLVVLNTETGAEVARMPATGECDDVFFDASRKRILRDRRRRVHQCVPTKRSRSLRTACECSHRDRHSDWLLLCKTRSLLRGTTRQRQRTGPGLDI